MLNQDLCKPVQHVHPNSCGVALLSKFCTFLVFFDVASASAEPHAEPGPGWILFLSIPVDCVMTLIFPRATLKATRQHSTKSDDLPLLCFSMSLACLGLKASMSLMKPRRNCLGAL